MCFWGTVLSKVAKATDALAEAFLGAAPGRAKGRKVGQDDWVKCLELFQKKAKQIRDEYSLGLLARARVAFRLQQRLLAAGFPPEAVRKVVFSLVLNSFAGN